MRVWFIAAILLAGCATPGAPDEPVEAATESVDATAQDVVTWKDCEVHALALDIPADAVSVPAGHTPKAGRLPDTIVYGIWGIQCSKQQVVVGYVALEGELGYATYAAGTDDGVLGPLSPQGETITVANVDGFELGPVRLRSAAGVVRVGDGKIWDTSNPLEAELTTSDPWRPETFRLQLIDHDGPIANVTASADFHPAQATADNRGDLPWEGTVTGTGWLMAGSPEGTGHEIDITWN